MPSDYFKHISATSDIVNIACMITYLEQPKAVAWKYIFLVSNGKSNG